MDFLRKWSVCKRLEFVRANLFSILRANGVDNLYSNESGIGSEDAMFSDKEQYRWMLAHKNGCFAFPDIYSFPQGHQDLHVEQCGLRDILVQGFVRQSSAEKRSTGRINTPYASRCMKRLIARGLPHLESTLDEVRKSCI